MRINRFKKSVGLFVALTAAVPQIAAADGLKPLSRDDKQRLIVTTDLGGTDPDDIQSMIHMLVCADRMDIEGLVSSQVWMDDPDKTPEIRKVVERYAEVLPNLKRHSAGFPDADYLLSVLVPRDASGKSIHLVLEVTDKGCPALTAYRRIVIGVK